MSPYTKNLKTLSKNGLSFRAIRDSDQDFLHAVYRSTREEEIANTGWTEAEKTDFIAMQFKAQHSHYIMHYPEADWLIVKHQGEMIGRLYLEEWPTQLRIIDIALIGQARNKGLGSLILRNLMDAATARGRAVSIHVEKTNPAMALYHRLGFETIEDKGVYDLLRWAEVKGEPDK